MDLNKKKPRCKIPVLREELSPSFTSKLAKVTAHRMIRSAVCKETPSRLRKVHMKKIEFRGYPGGCPLVMFLQKEIKVFRIMGLDSPGDLQMLTERQTSNLSLLCQRILESLRPQE